MNGNIGDTTANTAESHYYSIKELAVVLGLGESKTRKLVLHPNFPKIKIGRQYLIPKSKYKSWVETHLYKEVKI